MLAGLIFYATVASTSFVARMVSSRSAQEATGAEFAAAAADFSDGGGTGGDGDRSLCAACGAQLSTASFGTRERLRAGRSSSTASTERASMMFPWGGFGRASPNPGNNRSDRSRGSDQFSDLEMRTVTPATWMEINASDEYRTPQGGMRGTNRATSDGSVRRGTARIGRLPPSNPTLRGTLSRGSNGSGEALCPSEGGPGAAGEAPQQKRGFRLASSKEVRGRRRPASSGVSPM